MREVRGRRATIKNVANLFQFCSNKLHLPVPLEEGCCHTNRYFVLVETEDLQEKMAVVDLETLPETSRMHCLRPLHDYVVVRRNVSCFCEVCLRDVIGECKNKACVDNRDIAKLAKVKKRIQHQAPPISSQNDQIHASSTSADHVNTLPLHHRMTVPTASLLLLLGMAKPTTPFNLLLIMLMTRQILPSTGPRRCFQ